MMEHWSEALIKLNSCDEALAWAETQPDYETAWATCQRGEWLIWLLRKVAPKDDPTRDKWRKLACDIARTVLCYVKAAEERPRLAIEAAEAYARGEITRDVLLTARRGAADAAAAADDAYVYAAAAAAAAAAYVYAAAANADAAAAAADAAAAYAADKLDLVKLAHAAMNNQ